MTLTKEGKIHTNFAISPDVHAYLKKRAIGWKAMGQLIDQIVREHQHGSKLDTAIRRLEQWGPQEE